MSEVLHKDNKLPLISGHVGGWWCMCFAMNKNILIFTLSADTLHVTIHSFMYAAPTILPPPVSDHKVNTVM